MTDRKLRIFCTVVDQMSFSKAARILGITQPAVTQNIACLEKEMGFALFLRVSNSVTLTEKGEEFYILARRVLGLYREFDNLKSPSERRI